MAGSHSVQNSVTIRHPDRVREYEAKARDHILQHYSWDKVAENTEALYREVLASK